MYTFGADGKLVTETPKNGIVEEDGVLYYYENGQRVHKCLFIDGGDYYYAAAGGVLAVSTTRKVNEAWTNGLLPAGMYTFDAQGRMVQNAAPGAGPLALAR